MTLEAGMSLPYEATNRNVHAAKFDETAYHWMSWQLNKTTVVKCRKG